MKPTLNGHVSDTCDLITASDNSAMHFIWWMISGVSTKRRQSWCKSVNECRKARYGLDVPAHPINIDPGNGLRHRNRHPQERRRDRTNALTLAGVQALEERAQVFPDVFGTSIFLRGFERFHGFAVVVSEFIHQIGRRTGKGEIVNLPTKRNVVLRDTGAREPLDHVGLNSPFHRADKAVLRRR